MSLPVAVVNFDEFITSLSCDKNFQIDVSGLENIFDKYFPEIIEILNKIREQNEIKGVQRIKGFASNGEAVSFTPQNDILITGLTVSQSDFNRSCMDKWNLYINHELDTFKIIDGIYSKDCLQHKYFEKFYPVPKGYNIIIEPQSKQTDKTFWADLEYLELI